MLVLNSYKYNKNDFKNITVNVCFNQTLTIGSCFISNIFWIVMFFDCNQLTAYI